jgi:hypothetical protein
MPAHGWRIDYAQRKAPRVLQELLWDVLLLDVKPDVAKTEIAFLVS